MMRMSLWRPLCKISTPGVIEEAKAADHLSKLGTLEVVGYAVAFLAPDRCAEHVNRTALNLTVAYTTM